MFRILALFLVAFPAAAACTVPFAGPTFLENPAGGGAAVVTANLNRDPWPDLVIGGTQLSIALAKNIGGYESALGIAAGAAQLTWLSVAAADFDRDGDDDIVAWSKQEAQWTYFRNDGETFLPVATGSAVFQATVAAGDFNGDDRADFAVVKAGGPVAMFFGNGNGTFAERTVDIVALEGHALSGDFDHDGIDDLIIARHSGSPAILMFGTADGAFRNVVLSGTANAYPSAAGDLDGNGTTDVVFQFTVVSDRLLVLDDAASDARDTRVVRVPELVLSAGVPIVADIDDDAADELLISTARGVVLDDEVYLVLGTNGLSGPNLPGVVTDADRDGDLELVLPSTEGLAVLQFNEPRAIEAGAEGAADFNGDGRADLLIRGVAWLAQPDGTFVPTLAQSGASIPRTTHIADLDGDDDLDFVTLSTVGTATTVTVAINRGDGFFDKKTQQYAGAQIQDGGALADINGDGHLDLVFILKGFDTVALAFGNAAFVFGPLLDMGFGADIVRAGDVDADGDIDLLTAGGIAINTGTGFTAGPLVPRGTAATLADVNGDGRADVIADTGRVSISKPDGTFETKLLKGIVFPTVPANPLVRDFNGDGRMDILFTDREFSSRSDKATLFLGNALDGFGLPIIVRVSGTGDYFAADVNADGRADLVDGIYVRVSSCNSQHPRRRAVR